MSGSTDLYDSHYGSVEAAVYRAVRAETYDEDLGQTGWLNGSECDEFARWFTGCLSNAEIATRSAIAFFLFTPVGANEQFLRDAGFDVVRVEDVTDTVARTAKRCHNARATRQAELLDLEAQENYERLQRFLATVHALAAEGRLSRFAYLSAR